MHGILSHCIQHRLNVRGRAGDYAQNFTRRSLLFQRLLQFVEQPHVFNGDNGLISKGLQQLDLRRSKGPYLDATRSQRSNEFSLLTKRSGQEGAVVTRGPQHWEIVLRADVRNVESAMFAHPAKLWLINAD